MDDEITTVRAALYAGLLLGVVMGGMAALLVIPILFPIPC